MGKIVKTTEYKEFIQDIKSRIQASQIKAAVKVNTELLRLYWDLAQLIVKKQKESTWGEGFIAEISKDLKNEFPNMKGFSTTNLLYMKKWHLFYIEQKIPQTVGDLGTATGRQLVAEIFQIPWGHNREIITKCQTVNKVGANLCVRPPLGRHTGLPLQYPINKISLLGFSG